LDAPEPKAAISSIIPAPRHPNPPETYPRAIPVTALTFNADGSQLFASGYHEVTVWNCGTGQLVSRITNVDQRTFGMDLSPTGDTLAVASGAPGRRGEARLFDATSGQLKSVLGSSADVMLDIKYSPTGKRLAVATADSRLWVFDADTGDEQLVVTSHSDWVTAVAWSPDGDKLASASRDKTAKVFDAETGELVATYAGHGQAVRGVAFHRDGADVFSAGADNKIHRWKIDDGKTVAEIVFGGEVFKLPLADSFLFATSADKSVRQYDAQTQAEVRQYLGHQDWACSAAFHPTTKKLASGGFNGEVRIWDTRDGSQVISFYAAPGRAGATQ
jgi:WD40 repeat protein